MPPPARHPSPAPALLGRLGHKKQMEGPPGDFGAYEPLPGLPCISSHNPQSALVLTNNVKGRTAESNRDRP